MALAPAGTGLQGRPATPLAGQLTRSRLVRGAGGLLCLKPLCHTGCRGLAEGTSQDRFPGDLDIMVLISLSPPRRPVKATVSALRLPQVTSTS